MSKIHVKRVITIEYEYPFTEDYTNGASFDEMVQYEQRGEECGDEGRWSAINEGDFEEEVEVTLVPDPEDNLIPANGIKFLCAPTLQWIYNRHWYFSNEHGENEEYSSGLTLAFRIITELGNTHGWEIPLEGVREQLLNLRFEDGGMRDKALEDVVEFLNPTEDMGH